MLKFILLTYWKRMGNIWAHVGNAVTDTTEGMVEFPLFCKLIENNLQRPLCVFVFSLLTNNVKIRCIINILWISNYVELHTKIYTNKNGPPNVLLRSKTRDPLFLIFSLILDPLLLPLEDSYIYRHMFYISI